MLLRVIAIVASSMYCHWKDGSVGEVKRLVTTSRLLGMNGLLRPIDKDQPRVQTSDTFPCRASAFNDFPSFSGAFDLTHSQTPPGL
jgi:hypothetical protein